MSEHDDAAVHTAGDDPSGDLRSESAEAAERGPVDLSEAARLLGAGEDDAAFDAADEVDRGDEGGGEAVAQRRDQRIDAAAFRLERAQRALDRVMRARVVGRLRLGHYGFQDRSGR